MFHFSYLCQRMASSTSLVRYYVDYILFCWFYCPTNIAISNYGTCMEMKHTKQRESTFYDIRTKQMKYLEHMLITYVYSHYNICNI
jgi:hypothetical protein